MLAMVSSELHDVASGLNKTDQAASCNGNMQGANTDARCEHQQLTEMATDDYIQIMCSVLFLLCCFCCEDCCFCFFFSLVVIVSNERQTTE